MKKIILIAGFLIAGTLSANTISSKEDCTENTQIENTEINTNFTGSNISAENKAKVSLQNQTMYYYSSCGIAVSTVPPDSWGWAEAIQWAANIEANYCAPNAPYSNTSGL